MAKIKLYINNIPVSNIKAYWEKYELNYNQLRKRLYDARKRGETEFSYKVVRVSGSDIHSNVERVVEDFKVSSCCNRAAI